eukprot:SAG31_NODE_1291_length_8975_cov_26.197274_6_plen_197_part_00
MYRPPGERNDFDQRWQDFNLVLSDKSAPSRGTAHYNWTSSETAITDAHIEMSGFADPLRRYGRLGLDDAETREEDMGYIKVFLEQLHAGGGDGCAPDAFRSVIWADTYGKHEPEAFDPAPFPRSKESRFVEDLIRSLSSQRATNKCPLQLDFHHQHELAAKFEEAHGFRLWQGLLLSRFRAHYQRNTGLSSRDATH